SYHRDFAGRWVLTLARGTEESRTRLLSAIDGLWPLWSELFETHPVETAVAEAGIGVDPAEVADEAGVILDQVCAAAGIARTEKGGRGGVGARGQRGRAGLHTAALSTLLAETQVGARPHPEGRWCPGCSGPRIPPAPRRSTVP